MCRTFALLVGLAVLSACAEAPRPPLPDDPRVATAPAPDLVPLGPILAAADARLPRTGPDLAQSLASRAASLRARAERLRRAPLIDATTRARMARGISGAP